MGLFGAIWKVVTSPLGVLEDWANEPLKRWEHKRQEESKDRDVERKIREATGVEEAKARIQKDLAKNQADLQIRMQTEINRVNAETEQWTKDKEFERMQKVAEAVSNYQERLMELNLRTVRAIGEMDIELRSKAQALILEKTKEYLAIQNKASGDAENEFERILVKFSGNERILNIMISNSEKKLASIIDTTSKFLDELSQDIQNMNLNIDRLIQEGHAHTLRQLEGFNKSAHSVTNRIGDNRIQNIDYKELTND